MLLFKGIQSSRNQVMPVLALLLWIGLLLLSTNGQQSLMAHDEGWYALQSRWIVETGDWITPRWWGEPIYDRVIGLHWLISLCYLLFGVSDGVARLPNLFTSLMAVLLTYAIGLRLLNPLTAWIGAAILSTSLLWLQYSRMATQDVPLVCWVLLGIWSLLQAERQDRRLFWGFIAGLTVGLGFLFKSIMIVLPIVALSPYLLWQHRRHHHLFNPLLYVGVGVSLIPAGLWLWWSYQRYGSLVFQQLFGHLFRLGVQQFHPDATPLYYFWNIPANSFPWALFALIGFGFLVAEFFQKEKRLNPTVLYEVRLALLVVYPTVLFLILTGFSTRTPYYALQLYPWIALLAGVALDRLARQLRSRLALGVSVLFSGLAIACISIALAVEWGMIPIASEFRPFALPVLLLGLGWICLPILGWRQHRLAWLATWIMTPWVALMMSGALGLWGNYSADLKTALANPPLATVLQKHPIDVVATLDGITGEQHKAWVLLSFYTPHLGQGVNTPNLLSGDRYAWISPQYSLENSPQNQVIGEVRGWKLVHHQD